VAAAMTDGRAELEALIGGRMTTIAYPHGRSSRRVARAARRRGFEAGYTTDAGRLQPDADQMRIGRYWPSYGPATHFAVEVAQLLAGRWGQAVQAESDPGQERAPA
jgi:hypothetical protein